MTYNPVLGNSLALAALAAFSANIIVTRLASSVMDLSLGFVISVSVNVVLALALFIVQAIVAGGVPAWNGPAILYFAAAGIFATFLGRWLFFESISRLGAARASAFQASSPIFVAVLGWMLLHQNLSILSTAAIAMTTAGLILLSMTRAAPDAPSDARHGALSWSMLGIGMGACMAYAVGNIFRGLAVQKWDQPIAGALIGAIVGLALHLAVNWQKTVLRSAWKRTNRRGVALYATSGALTIGGQILFIDAMNFIPVANASLITMCTPLLVLPMSFIWLRRHDAVNWETVFGVAITVIGVGIVIGDQ